MLSECPVNIFQDQTALRNHELNADCQQTTKGNCFYGRHIQINNFGSCSCPAKIQINNMPHSQIIKQFQAGFTLMEMLITLSVVGVLVAVAMPNMSGFAVKQKLIGAAEQIYGHIQQARSDAIASSAPAYANFATTGTDWQYGVSSSNNCNLIIDAPATANACIIIVSDGVGILDDGVDGNGIEAAGDRVLMRFTSAEYTGNNAMTLALSGLGGGTQFGFDPVRGTLLTVAGNVTLTSTTGLQLRVRASALGRVSICSPNGLVDNYEVC